MTPERNREISLCLSSKSIVLHSQVSIQLDKWTFALALLFKWTLMLMQFVLTNDPFVLCHLLPLGILSINRNASFKSPYACVQFNSLAVSLFNDVPVFPLRSYFTVVWEMVRSQEWNSYLLQSYLLGSHTQGTNEITKMFLKSCSRAINLPKFNEDSLHKVWSIFN